MRHTKGADGKYHITTAKHGHKVYEHLEGSRAQVWHGTAFRTPGGLKKHDLMQNKRGRIVSVRKHKTAKKQKRLEKRMREQMEHRNLISAHAKRDEHVAKLRTCRIRDNALDIVLHQTDGCCEKCRHRTGHCHDSQRQI